MEINKVYLRELFFKADLTPDIEVTQDEIIQAESEGCITAEEADLLREAYGIINKEHKKNHCSCQSGGNETTMILWEYMQAVGKARNMEIFSKEDIKKANIKEIFRELHDNPEYYFEIDESYKNNTEMVLRMIECNAKVFNYLYSEQRSDTKLILSALQYNPAILKYLPEYRKTDIGIITAAISADALIYEEVARLPEYMDNKDVALFAIYYNPKAIEYVNECMLDDEFIEEAFKTNYDIVKYMKHPSRELRERHFALSESVNQQLNELGIEFTERIPASVRKEIIENRKTSGVDDGRPVALIVYPKTDENGAFITFNHMVAKLVQDGYKVVYYEVYTEDDIIKDVQEAAQARKIDLLLIGGHGKQDAIKLFSPLTISLNIPKDNLLSAARTIDKMYRVIPVPITYVIGFAIYLITLPIALVRGILALPFKSEKQYLDTKDAKDLKGLSQYMSDNSVVLVEGCSTGRGGKTTENLANMLGGIFTTSYVWAPMYDTSVYGFYYDENGKVNGINFSVGMSNTNVIAPKPEGNE